MYGAVVARLAKNEGQNQKNFNNISQQTITNCNLTNRVIGQHDKFMLSVGSNN
jgi:hypothetical protein